MALIDGVGDEVVEFVAVVFVVVVAALAWWSTNARPDRYRTVLVMRSRNFHPVTVSIRSGSNAASTSSQNIVTTQSSTPQQEAIAGPTTTAADAPTTEDASREGARVIRLQEMDSIVDADVAMMNHHRLHFYRRMDGNGSTPSATESTSDESEMQEEPDPPSNAQMREMDSIVNAMEAGAGADPFDTPSVAATSADVVGDKPSEAVAQEADSTVEPSEPNTSADQARILIKLKYLNDTLKEVDGSLDELLKDFTWRHFTAELSAQCRVRLIYNGRVLSEANTLRACGLRDNAVVHCLVHPPRSHAQAGAGSDSSLALGGGLGGLGALGGGQDLAAAPPDRSWDLENILMTLVSVALTIVWFFRCEYSNMFTASASVALFGLTVFYSVAIFGLYLSDTFHFDRRQAPRQAPQQNN